MHKQKVIQIFQSGHYEFKQLIKSLSSDQIININVLENWTVKDIIAHLAAWNWEQAKEINNILSNKPTWKKLYGTIKDQDDFNRKAVEESQVKNMKEVIEEWENSYEILIKRIKKLTEGEWNRYPTLHSLFRYEEDGQSDEDCHAEQVKKFFKL